MRTLTLKLIFVFSALMLSGCKNGSESTTTGNPFVSLTATGSASVATVARNMFQKILLTVLPRAQALPPPATMVDAVGNTVVLNQAWYSLGEIEFKYEETAGGGEIDGDSVEFQGPYSIDLFSANPTVFASGYIAVDQIRRVKFKLKKTIVLPTGAPADFMNRSLYLSGTVNGHTLVYYTEEETQAEVAGPNLVNAINNSDLLMEFKTANLIKRIDLSAVTANVIINEGNRIPATNPCPNIEPSANDIYTCFRKGLEKESNFGRDEDGDNQLDLSEESVD